ncbi:hypothetical protein D3C78_1480830 [compost metagenome]
MTLGPHALVKAQGLQRRHRQFTVSQGIGYPIGTDALNVVQGDRGVVRAKVQVHLAAVVTFGENGQVTHLVLARALRG